MGEIKHSPLPWAVCPEYGDIVSGRFHVALLHAASEGDKAFITRAVNSHYKLIKALEAVLAEVPHDGLDNWSGKARKALAEARGE